MLTMAGSVVASRVQWHEIIDFSNYSELLPLVKNSIIAAAILGVVGGLVGVIVITRDLPFAVHGISEISFAGASAALLFGRSVVGGSFVGAIAAALLFGVLGMQARERSSVIGVVIPFSLGLGILFLALYQGRAANKFGLLTGQIVAINNSSLTTLAVTSAVAVVVLSLIWRPLVFASVDPAVAAARGIPVGLLGIGFMIVLGATVAVSIQIVGALLVLALLCTPAAAAMRVTASPGWIVTLSVTFAVTAAVGGILTALGTDVPVSPYITTISFLIYLVCRVVGSRRTYSVRPARATVRTAPAQESSRGSPHSI
jgi:zinc/manganese transport system permease protein